MMLIINIPEMGCISGKNIPPLSIRTGFAGRHEAGFPDSGRPAMRIGASSRAPARALSGETCPLQIATRNFWRSVVVRSWVGGMTFLGVAMAAHGQTYY